MIAIAGKVIFSRTGGLRSVRDLKRFIRDMRGNTTPSVIWMDQPDRAALHAELYQDTFGHPAPHPLSRADDLDAGGFALKAYEITGPGGRSYDHPDQ